MRAVRGFTLIELLVAMVAASTVSFTALQVYASYHRLYLHLYGDYRLRLCRSTHRTTDSICIFTVTTKKKPPQFSKNCGG